MLRGEDTPIHYPKRGDIESGLVHAAFGSGNINPQTIFSNHLVLFVPGRLVRRIRSIRSG